MKRRVIVVPAACVALSLCAVGCKPWTTRPIHDDGPTSGAAHLEAPAYVAAVWDSRVLPEMAAHAIVLQSGHVPAWPANRAAAFVRGAGVIASVDTRSRVGRALVDLEPADGQPDVSLQIGPVLRGTAVRDALSFISFSDYRSQIAFAEVAGALNKRVLDSVLDRVEPDALPGRRIVFAGAAPARASSADHPLDVVPLTLEIKHP